MHASIQSQKNALDFINEIRDKLSMSMWARRIIGNQHYPSYRKRSMDKVLLELCESGYNGYLTIETDDKVYLKSLSIEDKVGELRKEREYLDSVFVGGT